MQPYLKLVHSAAYSFKFLEMHKVVHSAADSFKFLEQSGPSAQIRKTSFNWVIIHNESGCPGCPLSICISVKMILILQGLLPFTYLLTGSSFFICWLDTLSLSCSVGHLLPGTVGQSQLVGRLFHHQCCLEANNFLMLQWHCYHQF